MSEKKLSPRMKMISMMYLVLTALLALNVSAEILNAFSMIDKSIRTTTDNFQNKNEQVYSEFEGALAENPAKVQPWKVKADEVKSKSQALVDTIQYFKVKLVSTADNTPDADPTALVKKDDTNVGGQIMMLEGNGLVVKTAIEQYRDFLIKMYPDTVSEATTDALRKTLNTDEVEGKDGLVSWEEANFEHIPLAAVVALMSKMQSDIRNAEAQILAYLYSQIDAGSWKFNQIEAIVKSSSGYILQGQTFDAEIFIAASDTTKAPKVILSGGTELKVEGGKAIYSATGNSIGMQTVSGVIQVESPATGQILEFPFKSEYQVGAPSVAVSPTKMNVFYIGVDNPVDITASGVAAEDLVATMTGGSISKVSNGVYNVTVKAGTTTAKISVSASVDGASRSLGSKDFRIKTVPDPIAKIGGSKGGTMTKATLLAQTFVKAELENFDFDLTFTVTGFTVSATLGGFTKEESSTGATINAAQKAIISECKTGTKVYFESITAMGPDKTIRNLGTVNFKLN